MCEGYRTSFENLSIQASTRHGKTEYRTLRLKPTIDFNGDGKVNIKDLLLLIEAWGTNDAYIDIRLKPSIDGRVNPEGLEVRVIEVPE